MHDPLCVAFEIRRPWPNRRTSTGWRYWPPIITVWHREPGGHDSGDVCKHYRRTQDAEGNWSTTLLNGWRFHVHHWRIQVHAAQHLRRRLLTRCTWCGGRDRKGDPVNHSRQWHGKRGPWWRGEAGLYHRDCSGIAAAHGECVCESPICGDTSAEYGPYGLCIGCGKHREFGVKPEYMAVRRRLAAIPAGQRDQEGGHSNG